MTRKLILALALLTAAAPVTARAGSLGYFDPKEPHVVNPYADTDKCYDLGTGVERACNGPSAPLPMLPKACTPVGQPVASGGIQCQGGG